MPSIEEYLTNARSLAQEMVNAWGVQVQAGNAASLTPEFLDIFEKACRYQQTTGPADFFRSRNALMSEEGAEAANAEETARRIFIEAYKAWVEKHTP
jgi:hypothetical protein